MRKHLKPILIIIAILIIISLILVAIISNLNKKQSSNKYENSLSSEYDTIQGLLQSNGCDFISIVDSDEDGYKYDINMSFNEKPVDDEGNVMQNYYENIIKWTAELMDTSMNCNDFRMIDDQDNVIVRVHHKNNNLSYTINGEEDYFENAKKDYDIEKKDSKKVNNNVSASSNVLQYLLQNNWYKQNANFGSLDYSFNNYDVYQDEGYKLRIVNSRVFNIIFTKNYKDKVINDIGTGITDNSEITNKLGTPAYYSSSAGTPVRI